MIPSDSVAGLITIQNTGTEDLTSYALSTTVGGAPNVLTTDAVKGCQVWVARCTGAWTGSGSAATCSGTQTDALGTAVAPVAIGAASTSLAANAFCVSSGVTAAVRTARGTVCSLTGSDYLKVRVSLPAAADNAFQNLSTTFTLNFNASQAAGAAF